MIEIVGGASNFTHVTSPRLFQARLSLDKRQKVNLRQELLLEDLAIIFKTVICCLNVCTLVCARFIGSASVNHLSGTFYYLLGQRCPDNRGSTV